MSLNSCQMNTFNLAFPDAVESTRMPPEHVNLNLFSDAALLCNVATHVVIIYIVHFRSTAHSAIVWRKTLRLTHRVFTQL